MGADEIHAAWQDFDRRLLTFVEAMGRPQDRLILEVGQRGEVPTVEFRIEGGELLTTGGLGGFAPGEWTDDTS